MRRPDRYEDLGNGKHRAWFGPDYVDVTLSRERDYPGLMWDCIHLPLYEMAAEMLKPGSSVIDAGCGSGYGSALLADRGHSVLGIDASEEAIAFANRAVEYAWFLHHDLNVPMYADAGSQDAIIAIESVEHVRDDLVMLRSMHSNCRPGGHLFITTPERDKDRAPSPFHIREYSKDEFRDLIVNAGWWIENWLSHRDFPDTMIVHARKPAR